MTASLEEIGILDPSAVSLAYPRLFSALVAALDAWNSAVPGRYLSLTDSALRLAVKLWAQARNAGTFTADPKDLDRAFGRAGPRASLTSYLGKSREPSGLGEGQCFGAKVTGPHPP